MARVSIARSFGISPMVIGLTLVGFGTSAPELVASINAALKGSPGIALGNVVGSNIANVFLVLGVAALIFPLATNREAYRRDGPVLILATAILVMMVLSGEIGANRRGDRANAADRLYQFHLVERSPVP